MAIRLSDLVLITIKSNQSPPPDERLKQISYVLNKVTGATRSLRIQIQNRMNEFYKQQITQNEVINCLYILEYVVKNHPEFRPQMCDLDFIVLLQSFCKKKDPIQSKLLNLIEEWAIEYPTEMNEIYVMYEKYRIEGVLVHHERPKKLFDLPKKITELTPSVHHCIREIEDALENQQKHDLQVLFESSTKLSSKLNEYVMKCQFDERYDQEQIQTVSKLLRQFDGLIDELKNLLNQKIQNDFDTKKSHKRKRSNNSVSVYDLNKSEDLIPSTEPMHQIDSNHQRGKLKRNESFQFSLYVENEEDSVSEDYQIHQSQRLNEMNQMNTLQNELMSRRKKESYSAVPMNIHIDKSNDQLTPRGIPIQRNSSFHNFSPLKTNTFTSGITIQQNLSQSGNSSNSSSVSSSYGKSSTLQLRPPPSRGTPINRKRDPHRGMMSPINIYSTSNNDVKEGSYQSRNNIENVMSQHQNNEKKNYYSKSSSQTPRNYNDNIKYIPTSNVFESFDFDEE